MIGLTTDLSRRWDMHPRARGSFDLVDIQEKSVIVTGWIVDASEPIESASLFIEGAFIGQQPIMQRDDVGEVFNQVSHTASSGFAFHLQIVPPNLPFLDIAVVGTAASGKQCVLQRYFSRIHGDNSKLPPEFLRERVSGSVSPDIFSNSGVDNALQFIGSIRKFVGTKPNPRVLDWGCGVGRMDRYILEFASDLVLTGCDIDAEAVAWCNSKLRDKAFHVTAPFPPLPFDDSTFDAVIGYSVMTHLTWKVQEQWLTEIRRILAPGGFFITTLHGLFSLNLAPEMAEATEKAGILDENLDPALDGVAPDGYYRSTYQSPDFTRRRWGEILNIVDYVEGGISALHDIVTLQRP